MQISACMVIGCLLVFAAGYDIAAHIVPDYIPVLIMIAGFPVVRLLPALLGLLLVPLPFLAAALLKEGSIGGGDIKLMGACGFVLGVRDGYSALLLGLFFAVLSQTIRGRDRSKGFALVPYLAAGCLIMMLSNL